MHNDDLVSFVLVNYNRKSDLDEALQSILNQSHKNSQIIVVDNGSSDNSVSYIVHKYPEVNVIQLNQNLGPAKGRNIGVKNSCGKYISFLDTDAIIDKDWAKNMIELFKCDSKLGLLASKIYLRNFEKLNSAGGLCDILATCPLRGNGEIDVNQYNDIVPVFYAHSCAMMTTRKVFDDISGFDEAFFIYGEEVDFAWRTWLLGKNVLYNPNSIAVHKQIGSLNTPPDATATRQYLIKRNKMRMLIKNHNRSMLILSLPLFVVISLLEACYYLLCSRKYISSSKAILLALKWNIVNIGNTLQERERIKRIRNDSKTPRMLSKKLFVFKIAFDVITKKQNLPL